MEQKAAGTPGRSEANTGNVVSVIIVGDEILDGHTQDTNSHWLSQRLLDAGYEIRDRLVVRDGSDDIARALDFCLSPSPDVIFLCGGIGPTPDDVTFEAVAGYLGVPLVENAEALANLESRYHWVNRRLPPGKTIDPEMNEAARKMAIIPEGARVLQNREGAAPGLLIEMRDGARLFVLPGVPREFKWIVENSILDVHLERKTANHVREIRISGREANLAPVLRDIGQAHPCVSIGSYPQDNFLVIIRLSGSREKVEKALGDMRNKLDENFTDNNFARS